MILGGLELQQAPLISFFVLFPVMCLSGTIVPVESMPIAMQAASECDVLIVVGTSGSTNLPTRVTLLAARQGAMVIELNPDDNFLGDVAGQSSGGILRTSASRRVSEVVELLCP